MNPPRVCVSCSKEIRGRGLRAGSRFWHEHHFTCRDCGMALDTKEVLLKDGFPYCRSDYRLRFLPRCSTCTGHIFEDCIRALDAAWHPQHFTCYSCDEILSSGNPYFERHGNPLCGPCYANEVAPKCGACKKRITERSVSALGRDWHANCFTCESCESSFEGQKAFFLVKGDPICYLCVHSD